MDAVAHWEKILAAQPANNLARFSLGKVLFDAGRVAEAREHLARALEAKPDWMVVQILLGRCELALGNKAAARAAFERARQLAIEQDHEGPREEMEHLLAELS
jgi:predicted Zn-dependent protease